MKITVPKIAELMGKSISKTRYLVMKRADAVNFPKPIGNTRNILFWDESAVRTWINDPINYYVIHSSQVDEIERHIAVEKPEPYGCTVDLKSLKVYD